MSGDSEHRNQKAFYLDWEGSLGENGYMYMY